MLQAVVTAIQHVEGVSREIAEQDFRRGVPYTAEELETRFQSFVELYSRH